MELRWHFIGQRSAEIVFDESMKNVRPLLGPHGIARL
jgi:hypothetical protein